MIIVDTGVWLAFVDHRDTHHFVSQRFIKTNREPLITTWPVLTELAYLLLARVGTDRTLRMLNVFAGMGIRIFTLEEHHCPRIVQLMTRYVNLPMDLTDASLVVLAEHLGDGRIVSTDARDFHAYRWKDQHPFHNLLWEQGK